METSSIYIKRKSKSIPKQLILLCSMNQGFRFLLKSVLHLKSLAVQCMQYTELIIVDKEIMISVEGVFVSVFLQHYSKSYERIAMKLHGGVRVVKRTSE